MTQAPAPLRVFQLQTARDHFDPHVLEAAQVESDPQKRKKLWDEFQQFAMTELPIIPLLRLDMVTIMNKRVKNLAAGGLGIYDTFADVYVER